MNTIPLGSLQITPICLGSMTFGEQVNEENAHQIMDVAVANGINFIDTAEMYAVPPRAETFGLTEKIIGSWLQARKNRQQIVVATKVAGPSRGMPWVRSNSGMRAIDIINACEHSLKRLQTDYIDLYQIHWPERHVPAFGSMYFNPQLDKPESTIHEQLEALGRLVKEGKVREIGLSNETAYGVHEFVRLAEQHGLPRVVSIQNPYALVNRSFENGLDESCYRLNVKLLGYSPLGFGLLTGKYDASGFTGEHAPANARMTLFAGMRQQRWARDDAFRAAKRYNSLASENGMTPTAMALAFCFGKWQVASTIVGVTSVAQLQENIAAYQTKLSPEVLAAIDAIRWEIRDPAI